MAERLPSGKYRGPEPEAYIEVTRADGTAYRTAMPTQAALKKAHEAGRCGAMCGYCYHEAGMNADPLHTVLHSERDA